MNSAAGSFPIDAELLERVLDPYKSDCRYVRAATVECPELVVAGDPQALIHGRLSIGESCYIDDTGHFNSVEFNICYNQLVYLLMAQCVQRELLPAFAGWTLDEYIDRQLPDILIHSFASKFHRPMRVDDFEGTVEIVDAVVRRAFTLVHTRCSFRDDAGGHSHGDVSLAIVNRRRGNTEATLRPAGTSARSTASKLPAGPTSPSA